ncbi:MAG: PPK2 family polyphosphate kinase, partial [Pseudomonadota bacterium]
GRDAAGKDSTIKHVMRGVNPQGCQVFSFKAPSKEELDHNFLWRCWKAVPERGRIGIFNRSHYEEVLVVRVHPEYLAGQNIPAPLIGENIWTERFEDINAFERHLARNGTIVIKFFLNVSRSEQKRRFMDRLNEEDKNWKFSRADLAERALWDKYTHAFSDMLRHTSTEWAPWYVIPADDKDVMRAIVSRIIVDRLDALDLDYPELPPEEQARLDEARDALMAEED